MTLAPVDRLDVLVLVDNVTDFLSTTPTFVTRELVRLQRRGMRLMTGGAICCASHGLSLVITAHGPHGARTMLFDGGPVDYAVDRNGVRLGVDFGTIEAVMLSHGHWDHAGGIPRALAMIGTANGARGAAVPAPWHVPRTRPAPVGWGRAADGPNPDTQAVDSVRRRADCDARVADHPR